MKTQTTSFSHLVAVLLIVLPCGAVAANAETAESSLNLRGGRRNTELETTTTNYYAEMFSGPFGSESQTAFEYVSAETINEYATKKLEPIPFLQDYERFQPVCEAICGEGVREFIEGKREQGTTIPTFVDGYVDDLCVGPFETVAAFLPMIPNYFPDLSDLTSIKKPICDCVFNDKEKRDLDKVSIRECLQQCTGIEQPLISDHKTQCNEYCVTTEGVGDPEICSDACDCVFKCDEDEESDFDVCKSQCTSTYNGYVVFDFIQKRSNRLSGCVYENTGCDAVEADWNKDGCEIECKENPDYEEVEVNAENYLKLRKNICQPISKETCSMGPFCSDKFESCA